jgi:hypothetical protein
LSAFLSALFEALFAQVSSLLTQRQHLLPLRSRLGWLIQYKCHKGATRERLKAEC